MTQSHISHTTEEDRAYLELLQNYVELTNYLQLIIDNHLKKSLDLKINDYRVLRLLAEAKIERTEPLRMGDIALKLKASSSRLTYQINLLEKQGWVKKVTDESDRRSFHVTITDEGFKIYEQALEIYHGKVRELIFDNIRMVEIETVNEIHGRLLEILNNHYNHYGYKI